MEKIFKRPKPHRHSSTHGFTLIELMVVIAIIAIVALIAVPNFTRMQRQARTRSACYKTAQHFKALRERAITSGGTYAINFPDQYSYRLIRPDSTTQDFKLSEIAGGKVYFGGVGVVGQPPEGTTGAPAVDGVDFPSDILFFDGRGGATSGVLYITDGIDNYAVGVNTLGKIATYEFAGGTWNP
ncbi:MAG: prepilin-type N-terminal cleavage/methylation domain-containing protein [candidate division WOR-3 bacterium]|nr:MAG: prepilin-type N-terminal cleavage/methylation domain-containing protein [candidate division WOR-3 bacterium]